MSKLLKGSCISVETAAYLDCESVKPILKGTERENAAHEYSSAQKETEALLNETKEKADAIIRNANSDALKIVKQARAEADEAYKDAYEKGFKEGSLTAKQQVMENEKTIVGQLQLLLDRLGAEKEKASEEVYAEATDFAFDLAKKIINIEIDRNDQAFLNICTKAASHLDDSSKAVLRVGPREYTIASRYGREIKKALSGLQNLAIILDENKTGSCVFETDSGIVDASVDSQLSRARQLVSKES